MPARASPSSAVQARATDANPFTSGSSFAQGRGKIWESRWHTLKSSSPLELAVGHGAHSSYAAVEGDRSGIAFSSHNFVLWLLIETGVIGLALYVSSLAALARLFRRATHVARFSPAGQAGAVGLAALATFVLLNMFQLSINVPAYGWYFMLLFGATLRVATSKADA